MKRRYYILIAVCSYLFFTLASTPAATVISLAKSNFKLPAQFYGVQGSIWNGQADTVVAQGQRIEQLKWSLNPAALLLAKASADVQAQMYEQNIIGHVSVNVFGKVHAEDVRARINARDVQNMIAMPFGELDGVFNLNVESLYWSKSDKGLPETTATLNWKQAKLTLVDSVDLGQVKLNIKPDDKQGLKIDIKNKGGMLSVDGKVDLNSNKQYKLKIDFKPEANANENISQSLAMFAKRQSNGSYRFIQNGNLQQLGL